MPDIQHTIAVGAPPKRLWPALTTADGIASWWTLGDSMVSGSPELGGEFILESRGTVMRLSVAALDEPCSVVWRTIEANAPGGWDGTTITFNLKSKGGGTRVDFAHNGFAEDSEGFRKVTAGWAHYLQTLKRVIETGALPPDRIRP